MNHNEIVIYHHGIKGQKHGVRRFQYKDGSLTPAGILRYRKHNGKNDSVLTKIKAGYDKTYELLEEAIGTHNMRYARDSLAYASAALWLAAEIVPMGTPLSALAAVTNAASIVIDPD